MKIGQHTGKRATFQNKEGYIFETISWFDWYLFVFDSKIGHDAISYFRQHPEGWSDEIKERCWFAPLEDIKIIQKKVLV